MAGTFEKLKSEILTLPIEERAELAHWLIGSLDEEGPDPDATAAWDVELARRMEDIKSGKAVGKSADEVFTRLREKYS